MKLVLKDRISIFIRYMSLGFMAWGFSLQSTAQCPSSAEIWKKLKTVEDDANILTAQKTQVVTFLKKQFEECNLSVDSVYARILDRLAFYDFVLNKKRATENSIKYSNLSIKINSSGLPGSSERMALKSLLNLAYYHKSIYQKQKALDYFDTAMLRAGKITKAEEVILRARLGRVEVLTQTGDYQKSIEESIVAINKSKRLKEEFLLANFFIQRAQCYIYQNDLNNALADVDSAKLYSIRNDDQYQLINSMILKADIFSRQNQLSKTIELYNCAIQMRSKTDDYSQIADDYTDFGNIYLHNVKNYRKAEHCYFKTIAYANKAFDSERLSKAYVNLGQCYFLQHDYKRAEQYYEKALKQLKVGTDDDLLINPTSWQFNSIPNKDLILVILGNKTELLLSLFKLNNDKKYLDACLRTALVTDSVLTQTRYEQTAEQSKLYWRNRTKEFFTNALEACYLAHNDSLTFYFMEKSRAVLLNDKLNELGANVFLSQADANEEQSLRIKIISQQEKLNELTADTKAYNDLQTDLFQTKDERYKFIKSLEQKYPAYHQYKYADEMPALRTLQQYLANYRQEFVHYFMGDTVAYILSITATSAKMIRLSQKDLPYESITRFLQFCADNQRLNSDYQSFASLSHRLYAILFQPLQLPKGRVVICPDNFMLPFEALSYDAEGRQFLINDYIFSYVYSARFLLKQFNPPKPEGNFIGFAPVSFQPYLKLNELKQSAVALKDAAGYYDHTELFTNTAAKRQTFIQKISGYSIVNVFSHARADTSGIEPLLYMQDSVIRLSELQRLNDPATQLVVLSACQTNVGRNATGEGIYSLARGFAAAGIPAISATLWKADEQTIYAVSEKFHEFLSEGMNKDEALQKAKLYFMQNGSSERLLPYYWANMVLIGNAQPISVSKTMPFAWWLAGAVTLITVIAVALKRRKK